MQISKRWFIRKFSAIAAPLHALTSPQVKFQWNSQADLAFQKLRESFTLAPIPMLPDTSLQFVVEVDDSDLGFGAILSHQSQEDNKLHPCAFLTISRLLRGTTM